MMDKFYMLDPSEKIAVACDMRLVDNDREFVQQRTQRAVWPIQRVSCGHL